MIALNVSDVADFLLAQPPASVDLVFGSPPYALKGGRYRNLPDGSFVPQTVSEWVRWMAMVVEQSCRISRGMVFFVVDSPRVQGEYNPAVEGLLWTLATDKQVVIRTPHVWHKNGAPGGTKWPGHHWELVLGLHGRGVEPFYDPVRIGHAAKYDSGPGRQRKANGERSLAKQGVKKGALSRPHDVVRFTVGGGHMGRVKPDGVIDKDDDRLACSGEAPYPVRLADYFLRGWCPPGGTVCDPFTGTGTTAVAAHGLGMDFIGCDLRACQIEVAKARIERLEKPSC